MNALRSVFIAKYNFEKPVLLGEEELAKFKWSVIDGVASVELPTFATTVDFGEYHGYFSLNAMKRRGYGSSTSTGGGGNSAEYRQSALAVLKEVYANAEKLDEGMLTNVLNIVFYHGMIDRENNLAYLNKPSAYVSAVQQATSLENLYDRK